MGRCDSRRTRIRSATWLNKVQQGVVWEKRGQNQVRRKSSLAATEFMGKESQNRRTAELAIFNAKGETEFVHERTLFQSAMKSKFVLIVTWAKVARLTDTVIRNVSNAGEGENGAQRDNRLATSRSRSQIFEPSRVLQICLFNITSITPTRVNSRGSQALADATH